MTIFIALKDFACKLYFDPYTEEDSDDSGDSDAEAPTDEPVEEVSGHAQVYVDTLTR